jgi:hypothetical protein
VTDILSSAGRNHTNNWLKNGNFARVAREAVAKSYPEVTSPSVIPRMNIADVLTPVDVSLLVDAAPSSYVVGNWSISGSQDNAGAVDFDPINGLTGVRRRSFDSGHLLRVTFYDDVVVTLEQEIEVINQFRGMPASFAFSAAKIEGEVKVWPEFDFGTEVIQGVPFFASQIGSYRRVVHAIEECPLGMEKIVVRLRVQGRKGQAIGLAGCSFALGRFDLSLPYSENPGDVALPRGSVILWEGESCPAGYRPVPEADEHMLYQTFGDPNVLSGGTEEYPNVTEGLLADKKPETRETLGDDQHFVHQRDGMVGEPVERFGSDDPDVQRRIQSPDFNDMGMPPGPGPTWATRSKSLVWFDGHGVDFPGMNPLNPKEVEDFKRSTEQNEVLPGGLPTFWEDQHKHQFVPVSAVILPPYASFRFCEKI